MTATLAYLSRIVWIIDILVYRLKNLQSTALKDGKNRVIIYKMLYRTTQFLVKKLVIMEVR
jgi:hypothetical protein